MWSDVIDGVFYIRDTIFSFVVRLIDIFTSSIDDLIGDDPNLVFSIIESFIPDSLLQMNLVQILFGSLVPAFLVYFIIKFFLPPV